MAESIVAQVHKKATGSTKVHLMDNIHNHVRVMEIMVRVCIRMVSSLAVHVRRKAACSAKVHLTVIVTSRHSVKDSRMVDNVA
jgi:hypothetical protein